MSKHQTKLELPNTSAVFTIRLSPKELGLLSRLSKEQPLAKATSIVRYACAVGLDVLTSGTTNKQTEPH